MSAKLYTTAPVAMTTKYNTKLPSTRLVCEISPRSLRLTGIFGIKLSSDISKILRGATATKFETKSAITRFYIMGCSKTANVNVKKTYQFKTHCKYDVMISLH